MKHVRGQARVYGPWVKSLTPAKFVKPSISKQFQSAQELYDLQNIIQFSFVAFIHAINRFS